VPLRRTGTPLAGALSGAQRGGHLRGGGRGAAVDLHLATDSGDGKADRDDRVHDPGADRNGGAAAPDARRVRPRTAAGSSTRTSSWLDRHAQYADGELPDARHSGQRRVGRARTHDPVSEVGPDAETRPGATSNESARESGRVRSLMSGTRDLV